MQVLTYQCPNCGAPLSFNSKTQRWDCKFCMTPFEKETLDALRRQEEKGETPAEKKAETSQPEQAQGAKCYTCPGCGAQMITDETTAATFCAFCGNPTVFPDQLSEKFEPKAVIPFQLTKEAALSALKTLCKKKPLLPKDFKDHSHIQKLTGVYVPFWLFDCSAKSELLARGEIVRMWSDSNYNYTKTDVYELERGGSFALEGLPADASSKMKDELMDALEPFSYEKLVDFNMAYLSGFLAEKYDEDQEKVYPRIKERVETVAEQMLLEQISGYTAVQAKSCQTNIAQRKEKYVMLPVWLLTTKYQDKNYMLAMNGETGKMVGELPLSIGKLVAIFASITAAVTLIGFIGGMLLC